jgi:hypothetical protein
MDISSMLHTYCICKFMYGIFLATNPATASPVPFQQGL